MVHVYYDSVMNAYGDLATGRLGTGGHDTEGAVTTNAFLVASKVVEDLAIYNALSFSMTVFLISLVPQARAPWVLT